MEGQVKFIECFTTTFLHTHSWLNWVDEDDDEVGLKEKHQKDYIEIRPEAPGVWAKDLVRLGGGGGGGVWNVLAGAAYSRVLNSLGYRLNGGQGQNKGGAHLHHVGIVIHAW